ncbi:MAG: universal stress protein [Bacteroidales bacterium]|nr:universal stress protein [Bacteroidales bacterium]MCF8343086.1 universal stress protein [Bacteroidales bacterium]MCF8375348.1 universal stress protein [Bacteroidales bacterium]MCF8400204.1 universal stress protein [Bacteroidales bacterium]
MKKILVPIDFSENTEKTCQYALEIAKKFNSEIRLFHSYFDQIIVSDSSFPTGVDTDTMLNEQLLRDIEIRAREDIQKLQSDLLDQLKKENAHGVKVVYTLKGGDPESEIIEECEEYQPDLMIMGSSGRGKKSILTGSVSKKVMNKADIPVLAIPQDYEYKGISNVLYMTDFGGPDHELINKLMKLLSDFDIRIHCLHLNIHDDKRADNEVKMDAIKKHFTDEISKGMLSCNLIDSKDISDDIENFVKENNIHLIAFLSHKRNIFQRLFTSKITKKDLFQANIPLLAFHTKS